MKTSLQKMLRPRCRITPLKHMFSQTFRLFSSRHKLLDKACSRAHRSQALVRADPYEEPGRRSWTFTIVWREIVQFCHAFLHVAVAMFVAPLATLITSLSATAAPQHTAPISPPPLSSLLTASAVAASPVQALPAQPLSAPHVAVSEATGVPSASIDAVLLQAHLHCPSATPTNLAASDSPGRAITLPPDKAPPAQTAQAIYAASATPPPPQHIQHEVSASQQEGRPSDQRQSGFNTSSPAHVQASAPATPQVQARAQAASQPQASAEASISARPLPLPAVGAAAAHPGNFAAHAAAPTAGDAAGALALPVETLQLAGDGRDRVQDMLRALDNRLDNALSGAQGAALRSLPPLSSADPASAQEARALVEEAVELVEQVWLDARGAGLDRANWLKSCLAELESRPPRDLNQAHLLIKDFLGRGPADPYTRFIPPEEFQRLTKYDVSGVGLNIVSAEDFMSKLSKPLPRGKQLSDGGSWVVGLVKGAAAERAGVRQGDEIIGVDGRSVRDLNPFEVASLISSPPASPASSAGASASDEAPGSTLATAADAAVKAGGATAGGAAVVPVQVATVRVMHENGQLEDVSISRGNAAQATNPVTAKMAIGGRGIVQLRTFNNRAVPELKAAVARLQVQGATEIVLDLSDNRGGLVSEAVEIARLFLPPGATVVSTRGVSSESVTRVEKGTPITDLPLTVLVNRRSASASEILAGALRDNCRAVVAGTPTFGKGLIQSVYELADGSGLAVTVGRYLTPAGADIDRAGISPDFPSLPRSREAQRKLSGCEVPN